MLDAIQQLNPYLAVSITAMMPVVELRGSVPLGILVYGMNPLFVIALSVVAIMIPIVMWFFFLQYAVAGIRTWHPKIDHFFEWLFQRTRLRHNDKFERWGSLALVFFVAIPLPMTGAWTGTLLAYLFGIKILRSMAFIAVGLLITGVIMAVISLGGVHILGL